MNVAPGTLSFYVKPQRILPIYYSLTEGIHPIHVTAMMNKKRGLEGKSARQYVHRDVTSLLLHVPVT